MSENESKAADAKRFLSPSQKYEIWLQPVRQEATVAEVASTQLVDRSTIMRTKQVAKDGASAALASSRPGNKNKERDYELDAARAEIVRLSETVTPAPTVPPCTTIALSTSTCASLAAGTQTARLGCWLSWRPPHEGRGWEGWVIVAEPTQGTGQVFSRESWVQASAVRRVSG